MTFIKGVTAGAMLLMASSAFGSFKNGNGLYADLTSKSTINQSIGMGYVLGIYDSNELYADWYKIPRLVCLSDSVNAMQLADIVKKNLAEHPENRHLTADSLVMSALSKAFPCIK